jgi:hypothetical protein
LVAGIAHHEQARVLVRQPGTAGVRDQRLQRAALAGSGDGPCSWEQGGIGMFSSMRTFSQTLAQ